MAYLGIDLKTSSTNPSAVSILGTDSRVGFIGSFAKDDELLKIVETWRPSLVAIGTPLCLPEGLCCLETACHCRLTTPQKKGRQAELDLARMGISCFFTNKGSIIRSLIYRAIKLNRRLLDLGLNTIEVYPHGTKVILFGDQVPPKNSPRSLPYMKERLPALVAGLEPEVERLDRSACDSLINAHTALLHSRDATDLLGNDREGLVALPKLIRLENGQ